LVCRGSGVPSLTARERVLIGSRRRVSFFFFFFPPRPSLHSESCPPLPPHTHAHARARTYHTYAHETAFSIASPRMKPSTLTVAQLREELKSRGLAGDGLKAALVERLEAALDSEGGGGGGAPAEAPAAAPAAPAPVAVPAVPAPAAAAPAPESAAAAPASAAAPATDEAARRAARAARFGLPPPDETKAER